MERNFLIAVIIGIVIIGGIVVYQFNETTYKKSSTEEYYESVGKQSVAHVVYPDNPQMLGPLQINKDKYVLGENIYVYLKGLGPGDKGQIIFEIPNGIIYHTIDFDGAEKTYVKSYFKPQLLKGKNLCDKEFLIGEWKVYFRSYEDRILNFEMTSQILPNEEVHYQDCNIAYQMPAIEQTP